jgi:uncharacterized MAPEG superfamily protein
MTVAYWCVLIAAIIPFLFTGIAKAGARGFNNRRTRVFQDSLTGWRQRAHWAHQNGFEAFPPFAAAVIIAHLAAAEQTQIDALSIAFILLRLAYGGLYIADQPTLRSLVWFGGLICVVALFFIGV